VFVVDVADAADETLDAEETKNAPGPGPNARRPTKRKGGGKKSAKPGIGGGGDKKTAAMIAKPSTRRVVAGIPDASSDATRVNELISVQENENVADGEDEPNSETS
jgi:hypothetical protein